jgi:hypothetical protein
MMERRYIVGSRAFFEGMPGFKPKDVDILVLVKRSDFFKNSRERHGNGRCLFEWVDRSRKKWLSALMETSLPMEVGKVLVPDVARHIGLTIDDLKALHNQFEQLDARHKYERMIYDYYILNGGFFLTDEQRNNAFEEYRQERSNN